MMGPSIGAAGFFWLLTKSVLESSHSSATFRYLVFDPPHLVMLVGIVVSVVSLPIALEVSHASSEELEIPIFDEELAPEDEIRNPLPDGLGGVALSQGDGSQSK